MTHLEQVAQLACNIIIGAVGALFFVWAISGCGKSEYPSWKEVQMSSSARLYYNYSGDCKIVVDLPASWGKTEMTIEGKCK
jgi:hypothetical protein